MPDASRLFFIACIVLPSFTAWGGEDGVLYRETFANATGSGQPLSAYGWAYHLGPQGWNEVGNGATQGFVNEGLGAGPGLTPVASWGEGDAPEPNDRGFVVNALGPDGAGPGSDPYWNQLTHYATTELSIDRANNKVNALGFDLALSQRTIFGCWRC
ncbi:MAG: hypothetical protein AAGH92_07470 [Planctomycetota bacterium]